MAFRSEISIDWTVSPRIIEVANSISSITIQDIYDTCADLQARAYNTPYDRIVTGTGKQPLGGITQVGITLELNNALIRWQARGGPGTILDTINGGNLTATDANGDPVVNPISPSAFNTVTFAQSSSATLQSEEVIEAAVIAGSTPNEIRTALTQADGFYRGMTVQIMNGSGTVARVINDYTQANGAIYVENALPFTPVAGDTIKIKALHTSRFGR